MEQLIALLASAGPDDQSEVIRAALRFALDSKWITAETYRRANEMCNAGAFLDAALTLVPEGWTRAVDATAPEMGIRVELHAREPESIIVFGDHASEPIATIIAALKARATTGGGIDG